MGMAGVSGYGMGMAGVGGDTLGMAGVSVGMGSVSRYGKCWW